MLNHVGKLVSEYKVVFLGKIASRILSLLILQVDFLIESAAVLNSFLLNIGIFMERKFFSTVLCWPNGLVKSLFQVSILFLIVSSSISPLLFPIFGISY